MRNPEEAGRRLLDAYRRMGDFFGIQAWWPAETPFEVAVGAILTQNTNWSNVEKAIDALRGDGALSYAAMLMMEHDELATLIRPAGYFRVKAHRLRSLLYFIRDELDGELESIRGWDLGKARERLLSVNGVGPETADSILLYVGEHITFVVDEYTRRVAGRHQWVPRDARYAEIKEYYESALPSDLNLYKEYHALLVRVGKEYCRPTASCRGCPLEEMLPNPDRGAPSGVPS